LAKTIVGDESFVEVYVSTPLEICKQRDVKGLYHKASLGQIKDLTGVSSPYEAPEFPDIQVDTSVGTQSEVFDLLFNAILEKFC
jgi:adenylylsulfate kinase-like enzyme